MAEQMNLGTPFAFAFFCPSLDRRQPTITRAFCALQQPHITGTFSSVTRRVNILWRADGMDALDMVQPEVERNYPNSALRGIYLTRNYLAVLEGSTATEVIQYVALTGPGIQYLPLAGPDISLDGFEDGPIKRPDSPSGEAARHKVVQLNAAAQKNTLRFKPIA